MLATGRMIVDKTVLIISFLISIVTYTFWWPIKEYYGVPIFYVGTALSFVGYTFVLWRKWKNVWTEIVLAATTNSLIDELFFNPTELEINEYLLFLLVVILILRHARKRRLT